MNQDSEFPFDRARRVTPEEHQRFKAAISQQFDSQSDGMEESYEAISLKLHPKILVWAKAEAKRRGTEYQAVINDVLLQQVG